MAKLDSTLEQTELAMKLSRIKKLRSLLKENRNLYVQKTGKVFGIGLGKTGTSSLCKALEILGYNPVHNPQSLRTIDNFDSAADTNVAIAYKKLDLRYPGSKFILTVRNIDQWLESSHIHYQKIKGNRLRENKARNHRLKTFGALEFDAKIWQEKYKRHRAEVLEYFQERNQDLLLLDICAGEGWEKLCPFLDKDYPHETFPYLNKARTEEYFKNPILSTIVT